MAEQENKPDEPTSAPVAETETPKQSGWGGWFSSASVINTGWSVVNNLSSTIKETTKELFDTPPQTSPPENQENSSEDIRSVVDSMKSYLNVGLNKVYEISEAEELASIKELASYSISTASSTLEKAKSVAVSTTEMGLHVGQELAQTSVDVLETIGKSALDFLTVQDENSTTTNNSTNSSTSNTLDSKDKNYFEQYEGSRFVEALEKLSIESNIRLQKSTPIAELATLQPMLLKLKSAFDEEEEATSTSNLDTSAIKSSLAVIEECSKQIEDIMNSFSSEISSGEIENSEIIHLTASSLDKSILESSKNLSKFTAIAIGDLLNLVNSITTLSATSTPNADSSLSNSLLIANLANKIIEELNSLSNKYTDLLQSIVNLSTSHFKGEEADKFTEELQSKLNLHKHHIEIDTNSYASTLVDVKQFLFIICKSFFYTTSNTSNTTTTN